MAAGAERARRDALACSDHPLDVRLAVDPELVGPSHRPREDAGGGEPRQPEHAENGCQRQGQHGRMRPDLYIKGTIGYMFRRWCTWRYSCLERHRSLDIAVAVAVAYLVEIPSTPESKITIV